MGKIMIVVASHDADATEVVADVEDDVAGGPALARGGVAPAVGAGGLDACVEGVDELGGAVDDFLAHGREGTRVA